MSSYIFQSTVFKILPVGVFMLFSGCLDEDGGRRSHSVAVSCRCISMDKSSSISSIRGEGDSIEEAEKDAQVNCNKYFPGDFSATIENCHAHDPSLGTY